MPIANNDPQSTNGNSPNEIEEIEVALSQLVAQRGIRTTADFADFMAALMADVVNGKIDPKVANAACIAGDRLLRIAKMTIEALGADDSQTIRLAGPVKPKKLTTRIEQ